MMIDEHNHVGAPTPPTPEQRRAGLIADATVLANTTFGRDVIAALNGHWYPHTDWAEYRFLLDGRACWVAQCSDRATEWTVFCADPFEHWTFVVPAGMLVAEAAARLRLALVALLERVREVNAGEVVYDDD